jgi:hypothetical protein
MSQSFAVTRPGAGARAGVAALDPRRKLQLALAAAWLFDGILQYQPAMFTKAFPQMLGDSAHGNPAVVAAPITWSAGFVEHHLAVLNAVFATIQVALGLGIAWRPTVRLALGASVAWALGVWWFGEGLGGVLAGTASLVGGAPGAVLLYAVLAVLLWPADRDVSAPFVAGRFVGVGCARVLWLAVWGSVAVFAVLSAARAPQALSGTVSDMASAEPAWLAWIDSHLGALLADQGLLASVLLAAGFAIVAVGVFLPRRLARAVLVLALVLAVMLWLAQGLGGIFTGAGTDPNSAPLLALLALAFWPLAAPSGEGA